MNWILCLLGRHIRSANGEFLCTNFDLGNYVLRTTRCHRCQKLQDILMMRKFGG